MCGIEICESLLPMISLYIATKTDKMYNCIYKLFFVMHLKIVNKNLPQKNYNIEYRFLQWTIFSVKTIPLNESM